MGWFKYWPQFLVFLMTYGIEVQVKANSSEAHQIVSDPSACHLSLGRAFGEVEGQHRHCLLGRPSGQEGVFKLDLGYLVLGLGPLSKVTFDAKPRQVKEELMASVLEIHLLEGEILVSLVSSGDESSESPVVRPQVQVLSEYGSVELQNGSEVMLSRDQQQWIEVTVLKGKTELNLKGHNFQWKVPQGFSLRFGPVNDQGLAQVDLPQPLNIRNSLRRWAELHAFERQAWWVKAQQSLPGWFEAVDAAAQWHKGQVERQIAAVEASRLRQKQDEEKIRRENERLRRLFRQKNYLE